MVAADYLRASLYNSSSSNPVSFMVNGGLSTSKLTFRMPLNEHALTGSFEYTGSDKNPTATLVSGKEFLSVTRMSRSFTVTVNPSSALTPGIHTASIDVEAAGAKAGTLQVVVFVDGQLSTTTPKVTLISNDQSAPAGTSFPVNFDGGSLVVTSPDAPWLSAQISNGSQAVRGKYVAHVQVTASAIGMSAGRHIGTLVISQPGSSAAPASVAVELDEYFSGRYQAKTVVSNLPGMKFVCDHTVYTAPYTFLDPANTLHWCMGMTGIQQAGPGRRALFQNWQNGTTGIDQVLDAFSGTWQVNYQLQDKVTVRTNSACIGTVTPLVSWVPEGGTTTLGVTPNPGHQFIDFIGDLTGTARSFKVTKPMNVTAIFK